MVNSPRADHREPEATRPEGRNETETAAYLIWDAVPQITGTADEDWLL